MFDIGFSELMVIAIVALVVIGPERLPKVARTAGHMLGRLQRYVSTVKSDINREMQLEELRRLQSEIQESARGVEQSLTSEIQAAKQAVSQAAEAVGGDLHTPLGGAEPGAAALPIAASNPVRLVDPDKPGAGV
ncbi:MAG: twin-arginine translocase subunit TatB [Candidatus Accumulibacter sp.]|jgi:sec-independent protein translocase protein TatB|uniref:Sec-independent protein translocase protein TatB n=1 Tax=Accumulibacter sp. TaxID=2053492 RepID=UPI001A4A5B7D|nr:Sec-independent protein translocase protein TatB [Accumulibacter sp.]MBL8394809.1 twin-arginine translocase subunit TatB [Accumulibacter sp.]